MKYINGYLIPFLLLLSVSAFSQNIKQEKMAQLGILVGEWVGTSKIYENGEVTKEVPAFEKISYDLDSSILVVELNSQSLQLHTIIYYDEEDQTYYYYPFSKRGVNRATATFENGRLIVRPNNERRYIFGRTPDGGFREFGEKLVEGKWVKYFQDDFKKTQ
jgi:hypothetical protein